MGYNILIYAIYRTHNGMIYLYQKKDSALYDNKEELQMKKANTVKSLLLLAAFSSTLLLQGCAA